MRVEVNKINKNLKISQMLENILNNQSPYSDKFGLGYKNVNLEEGSSSMMKEKKKRVMKKFSKEGIMFNKNKKGNNTKDLLHLGKKEASIIVKETMKENIMINQGRN
jgi:phosphosulfolactate synthase (CoM biosynthesis protein A)